MTIDIPEETRVRYHALVDLSFSRTLTAEEAAEEERLGKEIDAAAEPFTAPILAKLEAMLGEARQR